jgi:ABC-type Fe3+-hydroxamate transport system substrate-binding protein
MRQLGLRGSLGRWLARYQSIPAVKAGKVYALPGKHITTTSHLIVKGVVDVQNLVGANTAAGR